MYVPRVRRLASAPDVSCVVQLAYRLLVHRQLEFYTKEPLPRPVTRWHQRYITINFGVRVEHRQN